VSRRTLPQLALRRLRALRVLPHLRAQRQPIRRRRLPVQRQSRRSLLQLYRRLLLQLQLLVPASRLHRLRRDPECHCGHLQLRAARPREHGLRRQGLGLCALLAHLPRCNAIHRVPARLLQAPGKRVPVRRKACALLAPHRHIVRAARRRVVLVVRQGSVLVDRLRVSPSVPVVAADQVVETIKGRSARSVPAREFPRRSQASRCMRASQQRADGR